MEPPAAQEAVPVCLSQEQWKHFDDHGYVNLGRVVSDHDLARLQQRIDDLMRGRVQHDGLLMQLDPGGTAEFAAAVDAQRKGIAATAKALGIQPTR